MSLHITLTEENYEESVIQASQAIKSGKIIVLAAEHAYMYICDAFNHGAVENIHTLRGDSPNTAAQVLVSDSKVLKGLAADFDSDFQAITDRFWPGLLTIQLAPQQSLNWDLGDGGRLGEFAVRVPDAKFLRAVLQNSGPVAAASAAISGRAASREISQVPANESAIAIYVDEGQLPAGAPSTLLHRRILGKVGGLEVIREGAISLERLQQVLPEIMPTRSLNPEEPTVN